MRRSQETSRAARQNFDSHWQDESSVASVSHHHAWQTQYRPKRLRLAHSSRSVPNAPERATVERPSLESTATTSTQAQTTAQRSLFMAAPRTTKKGLFMRAIETVRMAFGQDDEYDYETAHG